MHQIRINSDQPERVNFFEGRFVYSANVGKDFAVVIVSKPTSNDETDSENSEGEVFLPNCSKCVSLSFVTPLTSLNEVHSLNGGMKSNCNSETSLVKNKEITVEKEEGKIKSDESESKIRKAEEKESNQSTKEDQDEINTKGEEESVIEEEIKFKKEDDGKVHKVNRTNFVKRKSEMDIVEDKVEKTEGIVEKAIKKIESKFKKLDKRSSREEVIRNEGDYSVDVIKASLTEKNEEKIKVGDGGIIDNSNCKENLDDYHSKENVNNSNNYENLNNSSDIQNLDNSNNKQNLEYSANNLHKMEEVNNSDGILESITSDTFHNLKDDEPGKKLETLDKSEKNIIFRNKDAAKEFLTRQFSWMSNSEEYFVEYTEKPTRIIKENVSNMANLVYEGVKSVGDKVVTLSRHVSSNSENEVGKTPEEFHLPRITSRDEFTWSLSQCTSEKEFSEYGLQDRINAVLKNGSNLINCEVWTWGNVLHGQLGWFLLTLSYNINPVISIGFELFRKVCCHYHCYNLLLPLF